MICGAGSCAKYDTLEILIDFIPLIILLFGILILMQVIFDIFSRLTNRKDIER